MSKQRRSNRLILALGILIGGILAAILTLWMVPDQYNSTAEIQISNDNKVDPDIYKSVIQSDNVVGQVKEEENIKTPLPKLKRKVHVDYDEADAVYTLSFSLDNRRTSILVTDSLAQHAQSEVESLIDGSHVGYLKSARDGVVTDASFIPKVIYIMIGMLIGLGIGFLVTLLKKEPIQPIKQTDTKYPLLGSIKKY